MSTHPEGRASPISVNHLRQFIPGEQAARLEAAEIEYNSQAVYVREGRYAWACLPQTKRRLRARRKHLLKVAGGLGWSMDLIEV